MSDGYTGVALLGPPATGTEELGAVLEASGFFPVGRTGGIWFDEADRTAVGTVPIVLSDWADTALRSHGGSLQEPPTLTTRHPESAARLRLAFADARDCAQGSPLVVSDPRLVPMMREWLDEPSTEFLPVIVLRNPLGAARVTAAEWSIPVHDALAVWEQYMAAICQALNGRRVMCIRAEAFAKSEHRASDLLRTITSLLTVDAAETVRAPEPSTEPFLPDMTFETDDEFEAFATMHQVRLWRLLSELPSSPTVVSFPVEFQTPSDASVECLYSGTMHRQHQAQAGATAVRLTLVSDELRAMYLKAEGLERELTNASNRIAFALEEKLQLMRERDTVRTSANELLERIRVLAKSHAETRSEALRLERELAVLQEEHHRVCDAHREAVASLEALQRSETWMLGYLLVSPFRWLKEVGRVVLRRNHR
ncbi:MAG: hypothetical protein ACYCU7_02340 [Acidimicrobiales bacterium]